MRLSDVKIKVATVISTVGFVGYSPVAPGTVGTLAAFAVYWWLLPTPWWCLGLLVVSSVVGLWAADVSEKHWREKDPGRVCVDEFAGYLLAVAFLPKTLLYAVAAFILARVADIIKPWPAGASQKLRGGWGIMADDLIASLYVNVALHSLRLVALKLGWLPGVIV